MTKNNDLDEIICLLENNNLLANDNFEQGILKNRIDISYIDFINIYNTVVSQYKRCLSCIEFDMKNSLDKIIYDNMYKFINETDLKKRYNIMKITDNIIYYNIINK